MVTKRAIRSGKLRWDQVPSKLQTVRVANPKDKIEKQAKVDSDLQALIARSSRIALTTDGGQPQHTSDKIADGDLLPLEGR